MFLRIWITHSSDSDDGEVKCMSTKCFLIFQTYCWSLLLLLPFLFHETSFLSYHNMSWTYWTTRRDNSSFCGMKSIGHPWSKASQRKKFCVSQQILPTEEEITSIVQSLLVQKSDVANSEEMRHRSVKEEKMSWHKSTHTIVIEVQKYTCGQKACFSMTLSVILLVSLQGVPHVIFMNVGLYYQFLMASLRPNFLSIP